MTRRWVAARGAAETIDMAAAAGTSSHDEGDSARTEGDRAEAGWWAKGWDGAASAFPTAPGTRTKEQS
jgi:hypothetical protein